MCKIKKLHFFSLLICNAKITDLVLHSINYNNKNHASHTEHLIKLVEMVKETLKNVTFHKLPHMQKGCYSVSKVCLYWGTTVIAWLPGNLGETNGLYERVMALLTENTVLNK